MDIIGRQSYEQQIINLLGLNQVIVLTGHRRAGKSMILNHIGQILSEKGHLIFLDMENPDHAAITSYIELNDYIKDQISADEHNYLLIDEVQEIKEFERTLRYYAKQNNIDIIVTGSNAYMLSNEISTLFAGRNSVVHIYSLSYREFLLFYQLDDNESSMISYLQWGGLPYLHLIPFDDARSRYNYLNSIYNTIFVKDIVTKYKIRNSAFLDNLAHFIADNCGITFSANSIARFLRGGENKISANTVAEYTDYLCSTFMIDRVRRFDIKGKQVFEQQEKFYFQDIGIRNCLCTDKRNTDIEKVLENVVYLRLRQLGYEVFIGNLNGKEIDFVARQGEDIRYYQVSVSVSSPDTYEREYGNLKLIRDNYPKYVITLDTAAPMIHDAGIQTLALRQFLLSSI